MLRIYFERHDRAGGPLKAQDVSHGSTRVRVYPDKDQLPSVELEVREDGRYWFRNQNSRDGGSTLAEGRVGDGVRMPDKVAELLNGATDACHNNRGTDEAARTARELMQMRRNAMIDIVAAWTGRDAEAIHEDLEQDSIARHEARNDGTDR